MDVILSLIAATATALLLVLIARTSTSLDDGRPTLKLSGMQIITPETLEALASALTSLSVGESVCVTANDFKKLTGDDLTTFAAEGRLMIGNVSARTNCTIVTTDKLHQKPAPKLSLTYG